MPALAVQFCSQALMTLGAGQISAFDEGTDLAALCNLRYGSVRDALVASYPWRFTLSKAQLARLSDAPIAGYAYAFQLPADMAVLRALYPSSAAGAAPTTAYTLQGRQVLTDLAALWLDYQRTPAEADMPGWFRELLVKVLAAEFAMPVTDRADLSQGLKIEVWGSPQERGRGGLWGKARQIDMSQAPTMPVQDNSLIAVRF